MSRDARARALAALTIAAVVGSFPSAATAFVRTRTSAGNGAAWRTPTVVLHVPSLTAARPVPQLSTQDVLAAAGAAVAAWSHGQVDCTSVETSVVGDAPREALAERDGQNNVIFREDSWSAKLFDKDGLPIGDYEPNQLALTSLQIRASGEIVDADIEINAYYHTPWEVSGDSAQLISDGAIDLQNTLTHEFGHVLGFDHSCWDPAAGKQTFDLGVPVPACATEPALAEATMAPTAPPGDVGKRLLHADDLQALCTVYPFGKPVLLPPLMSGGGGCDVAAPAAARPPLAVAASIATLALAALAAVFRRRRAR